MSQMTAATGPVDWVCGACDKPLAPRRVSVTYMGSRFDVEMLCCPQCSLVYIPEDLAMGKMAEVERILEDK